VAEHVGALAYNGFFSVSANGILAYRTGPLNPQPQQNTNTPITVVLNWEAGLKK
jgi:hypothetical protein